MCSVFSVISRKKPLIKNLCLIANAELVSRGPDKTRMLFHKNKKVFIANNILSVTGKQSKGENLICSPSQRYNISFNGEIYNYKEIFENSNFLNDTETLAAMHDYNDAYKIPKEIYGMFAYVVYDKKQQQVFCAVDTQGEKHLFYYIDENFFIISSTIKSIKAFLNLNKVHIEINKKQIDEYFYTRHYMPLSETAYKKINILQNGKFLKFDIQSFKYKIKSYDNPINWISEEKYYQFKNSEEKDVINELDQMLKYNSKKMVPDSEYGLICSGGIDSSLQSYYFSRLKKPKKILNINHLKKDQIIANKKLFEKALKNKIEVLKLDPLKYKRYATECYKILQTPLYTHDLPSRLFYSKEFKKNNCKVIFVADGVDELFFSQQIYLKVFGRISGKIKNLSPYSNFNNKFLTNNLNLKNEKYLKNFYEQVYEKYKFVKNSKERSILSSLFCDYFIQSIFVGNRSNDLITSSCSLEPRNIYIQKNILKMVINLPFLFRYNKNADKNMRTKYILKKIFIKYFDKKLVLEKEGFSGFPEVLNQNVNFKKIFNFWKYKLKANNLSYYDKNNYNRDKLWKVTNINIFLSKFI